MGGIDLLLLLFGAMFIGKASSLPKNFNLIAIFQIYAWVLFFCFHQDFNYLTRIFFILTSYLALMLLHSCRGGIIEFAKFYNNIILWMAIGGVISFFLMLFLDLHPLFEFENPDTRIAGFYGLTCTNARYGRFLRYSGFFDEPGSMAAWGMYALVINRLFVKDNKYENTLIILLSFTFSMAYYIQLCFFFIFFKLKSAKSIVSVSVIVSIALGVIYVLKDTDYDQFYKLTFKRFELNQSTGKLNGDNRSDLAELAKAQFLKAPIVGQGPTKIAATAYMGDNPYANLATDGILGTIVMYLPLIYLFFVQRNKMIQYAIIILILGYLQRPLHPLFIHSFMLYMFTLLSSKAIYAPLKYMDYVRKYR